MARFTFVIRCDWKYSSTDCFLAKGKQMRKSGRSKASKYYKVNIYPSDSASTNTSSPSSPAAVSLVVDKVPVDVVTIGTDWEACSEASEVVLLSVNTFTSKQDQKSNEHFNFVVYLIFSQKMPHKCPFYQ